MFLNSISDIKDAVGGGKRVAERQKDEIRLNVMARLIQHADAFIWREHFPNSHEILSFVLKTAIQVATKGEQPLVAT